METIHLSPERAAQLLEHNTHNRPVAQRHVDRIARQIADGHWRFNGDTIKVSDDGEVLDGQHRLWAVVETQTAIETIVVYGIAREAFATIDTVRKQRSGGDTLSLVGVDRYRNMISEALKWLLRYRGNFIEDFRAPIHKIENSDIEVAYAENKSISKAVEKAMKCRGLGSTSLIAFVYYIAANRNEELADRMMDTLVDPSSVNLNDPFFRLRSYFTGERLKQKDPLLTIALMIKALNAAAAGQKLTHLQWKQQGERREEFPKLKI